MQQPTDKINNLMCTIRMTDLALSYSTTEYAVPVWARSPHANNLDPESNQACQSVTETRAPTAPRVTIQTKTQLPSHPLHNHTTYFNTLRLKKHTIFNNGRYTTNIPTDPHTITTTDIKTNMRHIHTSIVSRHLATRGSNIHCTHVTVFQTCTSLLFG